MSTLPARSPELDDLRPAMPLSTLILMLLAVAAGTFAAVVVLPRWLPGLNASLLGSAPKAFWYLSRASALVAYSLLWLSMTLGVAITNRLARLWPGGPTAYDVHQHTSLLGLAFALFHGVILIGDQYIGYNLFQVLVPFSSASYRPLWVGLGQVGFYLLGIVGLSFYVRRSIGSRVWRLIHLLSYAVYLLALTHGVVSGTDSGSAWAQILYWTTGGSLLFLTLYRVIAARGLALGTAPAKTPKAQASGPG
jgi:predicted ferric reductase